MIIPESILLQSNAKLLLFEKDDYIFYEDDKSEFYYQIKEGSVKMSSFSTNGQEFIQGIFKQGQSFGEPAIFGNFPYPNNAISMEDSKIYRIPRDIFFDILKNNFDIHRKFTYILSERLRYKATILKEISSYYPEHIIMTLLNYIRNQHDKSIKNATFLVPYTRQQIADMTGLRVETVIRSIKKLESAEKLIIKNHKIYMV